ncbi:MAG: sensor histidine kinase, partial [Pedobacter sp.]
SPDYVIEMGLTRSITNEVEMIGKTGVFEIALSIVGDVRDLGAQKELITFRIVQEILNNALKHSEASKVEILLQYQPNDFVFHYTDNGKGFDPGFNHLSQRPGLGMKSIQSRASVIHADLDFNSAPGKGTKITLHLIDV